MAIENVSEITEYINKNQESEEVKGLIKSFQEPLTRDAVENWCKDGEGRSWRDSICDIYSQKAVETARTNALEKFKKEFPNAEIVEVSAATHNGTKELIFKLKEILESLPEEEVYEKQEFEDYVLYEFKHEKPYKINHVGNKWIVTGDELEKLLKMTRFNSDESALRFARKLKNLGVDDELKSLGAKEGDTVQILDQEFEYEERLY